MGRDDAASAVGISRELAAFHLDRLVAVGLLQPEFRRRSGRSGPGAGRPAKLYRRAPGEVDVSLPARRYDRAADLMASALQRLPDREGIEALAGVARERGASIGSAARERPGRGTGRTAVAPLRELVEVLGDAGFEPDVVTDSTMCLRNCPYDSLVAEHRDVTCGMNLAWAEGVVQGLGARDVSVELDPEPGRCCVVFHADPGRHRPVA